MGSIEEISEKVRPVAEKYGMLKVSLFGSRSRGDYDENSDYDFCIVPAERTSGIKIGAFLMDLRETLGSEVNVVCERSLDEDFREFIKPDLKIIYEV